MTSTNVAVPLIAKRLANGFANSLYIQNISNEMATVTLTYLPEGGGTPIVRSGITIGPGESYAETSAYLQLNFQKLLTDGLVP